MNQHDMLTELIRLRAELESRVQLCHVLDKTMTPLATIDETRAMNKQQRMLAESYIAYGTCLRDLIDTFTAVMGLADADLN